jgi:hypothetical protein
MPRFGPISQLPAGRLKFDLLGWDILSLCSDNVLHLLLSVLQHTAAILLSLAVSLLIHHILGSTRPHHYTSRSWAKPTTAT